MTNEIKLKKNDIVEVEVTSLTPEAVSVAEYEGYTIHFENALIGEKISVKIVKVIKNFAFAKLIELLETTQDRVEITNLKGYQTGIIPLQHMKYDAQLDFKHKNVCSFLEEENLNVEVRKTIGMRTGSDFSFKYRNKAQVPVRKIEGVLQTGMFRKNTHDLVPLRDYFIQDLVVDEAILRIRNIMRDFKVVPYVEETHEGNLRNIIVRRSEKTGQLMVVLVTRKPKLFQASKIVDRVLSDIPNVVSIVQNVHPEKSNTVMGEKNIVLYGKDYYEDELLGYKFRVSSKSFYQVNSKQTEVLYAQVLDALKDNCRLDKKCVLDAYCGIGTITLAISGIAEKVYGVEIVSDAVKMAKVNAELNGVENVDFKVGAVEEIIPELLEELKAGGKELGAIVVDPPRKGLEKTFIDTVLEVKPETFVYVSCNPKTMARDLALLVSGGYEVKYVQPVDMFPMTTHVECVALLQKTKS